MNYKIGIDVGGTTIDYALVDSQQTLLAFHKCPVQENILQAILQGLEKLLTQSQFKLSDCSSIHLGTTIALNSLLELKNLNAVGLIRIAPQALELPPAYSWPEASRHTIVKDYYHVPGGKEYDQRQIIAFDPSAVERAALSFQNKAINSIAIVGVFSPLYPEEELAAKTILQNHFGAAMPITLSHQIGGLGYIDRENSALINAALKTVIKENFNYLIPALNKMGFAGQCYLTQNNGTLLSLQEAFEFPVKTLASGPTNSLVGATKLAKLQNALVVDIGGTSTDVGIVENGFPRYSIQGTTVAEIPLNLLSPDIHAVAMGGGSIVQIANATPQIGPTSIGPKIFQDSISAGGDILTLYDIGNFLNFQNLNLTNIDAQAVMDFYVKAIQELLASIPTRQSLPVILVGGGAQAIPEAWRTGFIVPPHFQVANAYGAALSELSYTLDTVVELEHDREATLQALSARALAELVQKGVKPEQARIIDQRLFPFYYMPKQLTRVVVTAAGQFCQENPGLTGLGKNSTITLDI